MNIDYSLLFLAYISTADECIYDKSLVLINEYIIQNNISEESKIEMHKILGDTEDKISLESVLSNISDYDIEKIKEILYIYISSSCFNKLEFAYLANWRTASSNASTSAASEIHCSIFGNHCSQ